jgi:hypothetical protein
MIHEFDIVSGRDMRNGWIDRAFLVSFERLKREGARGREERFTRRSLSLRVEGRAKCMTLPDPNVTELRCRCKCSVCGRQARAGGILRIVIASQETCEGLCTHSRS